MLIHDLYAYLRVKNAAAAIEFYATVFGGTETFRLAGPNGRVGDAQLDIGGTVLMLSDEFPEHGLKAPRASEDRAPFALHVHVDNADALIARAKAAGADVLMEPKDQFYGERIGVIRDPFGHEWMIGQQLEQVDPEEAQRRYDEINKGAK